jgi:uncharacterized repeat protein (TIGR01451 family)
VTALSAAPARRRAAFVTLPLLLAALLAPLAAVAPAAGATLDDGNGTTIQTGFQIDGDKISAPVADPQEAFDWNNFLTIYPDGSYEFDPTGEYETADTFQSTGIVAATFAWDNGAPSAACDVVKEDTGLPGSQTVDSNPWAPDPANVAAKGDGCSFATAYEVITDGSGVDHYVLYGYWTRLEGNGNMTTYQTLEGGKPGRCDDYLVEFNYDDSSSMTSVRVLEWTPNSGDCVNPAGAGTWSAVVPNFPYHAAVGVRTEGPDLPAETETFGEFAVDLTLAGLFSEDSCTAFKSSGYVTRTGESGTGNTSQLLDYVEGVETDDTLTISNCGSISITKASDPEGLDSDAEFGYEVERVDGGVVSDDTLAGTDQDDEELTNTYSGTADHGIAGSFGLGDTHTWGPIFAGDYTLTEMIDASDPFTLLSVVCTVDGDSVVVVDDGESMADVPVLVGEQTDCVITNAADPASVEVTKTAAGITEDVAWSFDITLSPTVGTATKTASGTGPGTDTVSWENLELGTTYTLSESTTDGWTAGTITCTGLVDADGEAEGFQFVAAPGLELECALTNTADPGEIVVTKSTEGDDGTFVFELTPIDANDELGEPITESATTTGGTGTATFSGIVAGSRFSIAEADPGAAWLPGFLTCEVTPAGSQDSTEIDIDDFTVNPGDAIECEITNTKTGTIVVVKSVEGSNGTFDFTRSWPSVDTEFELTTTEPTDGATETFSNLAPGSYSVSEIADEGYDGVLECSDTDNSSTTDLTANLTLDAGETIICTWTNTQRGQLVVVKQTVPDGSEEQFDFVWNTAGGDEADETAFSRGDGQSYATAVVPGDYTVTETAKSGWSLSDLECLDGESNPVGTLDGATATVSIGAGETVTCTYENSQRGPLEFDKTVKSGPTNNGDGTWTIEYTLKVTSSSNIAEDYDLEDELDFGDGIVPASASVTSANGVALESDWDGVDHLLIADDATIPALGTHTYTVTVTAEVPTEMDPDAADCQVADGEGSGFLNAGSIEFWSGTDADDACAALPVSDLAITKDAEFGVDFEPADGPTEFDYDIVIENLGPATAEDVVLEDPLPAGLEFVEAVADIGTCGFAVGVVTCELGDLGVNETRTVTITVSIPVDYPIDESEPSFTIVNVATTSTITPESDLTNNEDDAETTVLVTLPDPPDDPEEPELPTLALTGAAIGVATQVGLSLLAVGFAFAAMSLRRRTSGRHVA